MPEKYFVVEGIATRVCHTGPTTLPDEPPDLSRGETILCLHGAGGNGGYFADLLRDLSARHSPLAFDQPGHGRSGGLDSLGSIERMAAFLGAFIDKLGLRPPVLLGHSMGGAVALRYALDRPDAVRALVLCGSGARFRVPEELLETERRVTEGKERRRFTRDAFSPRTPDEIVRRGWMEDARTDPRAAYGDLLACAQWDAMDRLAQIRVPTLVVVGEDEQPRLLEQSELLATRLRDARRRVIAESGHALPLEKPAALAAAVEEFLAEALR